MKLLPIALVTLALAACAGDEGPQEPEDPEVPVDQGNPPVAGCTDGTLESGALSRLCFPPSWNGELVLYAHGYEEPGAPLALPDEEFGGVPVSEAVTGLGYGYATTSYRANGLVAVEAVEDLAQLVASVRHTVKPDPTRVLVVGVSEGGLVAALAIERHPDLIDGALPACGPIGDFGRQVDYFGDVRVLFDYYFPGVLPGTAVDIPEALRSGWDGTYEPAVLDALAGDPGRAGEIAAVAGVPASSDPDETAAGITEVLWYNVFATEDAQARLGGQPYDNTGRDYDGSGDDPALNAAVARFAADSTARAALAAYQATGDIPGPVVTLHTTGDPIVPFFHESLYADQVAGAGRDDRLEQRTVDRFGHCTFTAGELLAAFGALGQQVAAGRAAALRR